MIAEFAITFYFVPFSIIFPLFPSPGLRLLKHVPLPEVHDPNPLNTFFSTYTMSFVNTPYLAGSLSLFYPNFIVVARNMLFPYIKLFLIYSTIVSGTPLNLFLGFM